MIRSLLQKNRRAVTGYLFILPWFVGFLLFMAYPIYFSLHMSVSKVTITPSGIETMPVNMDNFKYAFLSDPDFITKLLAFLKSVIFEIPIVVIFSMFVALLINQPIRFKGMFRAIFFLPVIITSSSIVTELFSAGASTIPVMSDSGIVDFIQMNLPNSWSHPIINVIDQLIIILWYSGVQILIFLTGLQKVNSQVYEAASIDGASPWVSFWKITLPAIKPFILVNIIYTTVDLFTNSVNDVIGLIKDNMFRLDTGFGYSSALAWIYMLFIVVILLIILVAFGRKDDYVPNFRKSKKAKRAKRG